MSDISNKSVAVLVVGAVVLSLVGTLISLQKVSDLTKGTMTGLAFQENGTVQLDIQTGASIRVARGVNFGSITPNSTTDQNISTDINLAGRGGAVDCSTVGVCSGLEIENDGNARVNVTMNTTINATDLLVAERSRWSFYAASGNSSSTRGDTGCSSMNTSFTTGWTNFQKNQDYVLCYNNTGTGGFWYNDSNDTMTIEFNLTIPGDAAPGAKTAYIQFWNNP